MTFDHMDFHCVSTPVDEGSSTTTESKTSWFVNSLTVSKSHCRTASDGGKPVDDFVTVPKF